MLRIKRERGDGSPRTFLPFRSRAIHAAFSASRRRLGGQNLAALGTAAGENLAAVGSSHSLTETVDLGTMTAAGLIGTLHEYTSCFSHLCSTDLSLQQHIITDYTVMLGYYSRKRQEGQQLFLTFSVFLQAGVNRLLAAVFLPCPRFCGKQAKFMKNSEKTGRNISKRGCNPK